MKKLIFLLLLLAIPLSEARPLLIGTTTQNPPFNSLADNRNHFYGFDIDIMTEICRRIHQTCTYSPMVFNKLFSALKAEQIDLAVAAIIITQSREEEFLFSLPYLASNAQFMTLNKSAISSAKDLAQKNIGTRIGTPFKDLAEDLYGDKIHIQDVPDVPDLLEGLNNKSLDAVLMDAEAAQNWHANNNKIYKLIGSPIPVGNGYGIMANLYEHKLISEINEALLSMQSDGTYVNIYSRYFTD